MDGPGGTQVAAPGSGTYREKQGCIRPWWGVQRDVGDPVSSGLSLSFNISQLTRLTGLWDTLPGVTLLTDAQDRQQCRCLMARETDRGSRKASAHSAVGKGGSQHPPPALQPITSPRLPQSHTPSALSRGRPSPAHRTYLCRDPGVPPCSSSDIRAQQRVTEVLGTVTPPHPGSPCQVLLSKEFPFSGLAPQKFPSPCSDNAKCSAALWGSWELRVSGGCCVPGV